METLPKIWSLTTIKVLLRQIFSLPKNLFNHLKDEDQIYQEGLRILQEEYRGAENQFTRDDILELGRQYLESQITYWEQQQQYHGQTAQDWAVKGLVPRKHPKRFLVNMIQNLGLQEHLCLGICGMVY